MPSLLAILSCFAISATALALPQVTTGTPSTSPQPFASNTTLSCFTGKSFAAGKTGGIVPPGTHFDLEGCGIRIEQTVIQSMYCIPLMHSAISIGQTDAGICTFTLFTGSENCEVVKGGKKREVVIANGQEEVCIGTGVLDGGRFQHASGVWACG